MDIDRKAKFKRAREVTYLDTAAEGLPPAEVGDALQRYFEHKSMGSPGRRHLYETERETTGLAARLLNTDPVNVAFLAHASQGLNLLANSIDWTSGDEVLISDLEFPSNVVVWLRLREKGVRVRVVESEEGIVPFDRFVSQIGERTRVVSVSQVSYKTGTQLPYLEELGREAHRAGAIFCVDATQALGRVPVSLEATDFLVASTYKWLLGSHGLGIVYMAPELRAAIEPATAGWYSVEKIFTEDRFRDFRSKPGAAALNPGMPNFPALYALRESLNMLLNIGIEQLNRELAPKVHKLRNGIEQLGLKLLTPPEPEYASGIVSFGHATPEKIGATLERQGVIVWSGDGRVRASVHLYNDEEDIERFLTALA